MVSSERELISLLGERFAWPSADVRLGIGDDAAVLATQHEPLVVSVDASVEGVHFDLEYLTAEDVGYRSFQAAVSDLAAMGAHPVAALSALVLPRQLSSEAIDQLTLGQAQASRETGCPVVGGNVARGR
ncbi:MAG TPA: AIR synthase related protein, partial [Polyangiaceae bacterium]|nr:AIR synthase related protein [Polyangiaceae bacterium]